MALYSISTAPSSRDKFVASSAEQYNFSYNLYQMVAPKAAAKREQTGVSFSPCPVAQPLRVIARLKRHLPFFQYYKSFVTVFFKSLQHRLPTHSFDVQV